MKLSKAILFLIFFYLPAHASAAILIVEENLPVYSQSDEKSQILTYLKQGDQVRISKKTYKSNFRKVLVTIKNKKRRAFVNMDDILESYVTNKSLQKKRKSFGLGITSSFSTQGERSITAEDSSVYNISSFSSLTHFPEAFFEFPLGLKYFLRLFVTLRTTDFSGDSQVEGGTTQKEAKVEQTLTGFGGELQFKKPESSTYWWAIGVEAAKASEVTVELGGSSVATEEEDLPFFFILSASFGADINLTPRVYFSPQFRLQVISNATPTVLTAEVFNSVAYRF